MNPDIVRGPESNQRRFGAGRLLPLSLLAFSLQAACGGGTSEVLYFSAIPDDNKSDLEARYDQVAAHLTKELGVAVEYRPSSDYGASVEAFKNGDIQLAWFGGVSGVQARQVVADARAIAQGRVDPEFKSYFIAHADAGVELGDSFPMTMLGKTFTFGPRGSTSGRLMPEYEIRQRTGMAPEHFFAGDESRFSQGHDQTALEVASGAVQCGALNFKTYDRMVADGTIDPAVCVTVWTTQPYPDYNWTAHPMLDVRYGEGFIDRLQATLIGITDPGLLKALDREEGIIAAKNEDFAAIEETMRNIGMLR